MYAANGATRSWYGARLASMTNVAATSVGA